MPDKKEIKTETQIVNIKDIDIDKAIQKNDKDTLSKIGFTDLENHLKVKNN